MKISNWPNFTEEELSKVVNILHSGKVNAWTGNEGKLFEKEFANFTNSKYAIAIANGSLALWSAYKALNLKKNDEIITTPRTFIATSASAIIQGIKTVFADVDRDSGAITAESVEKLITNKTKAISVVHIGGWPADMRSLNKLALAYNLSLIEDCSQAHGAMINNKSVGSFGDIGTWSFCNDKIISTGGEGGMITTSNKELMDTIWSLKDHGKTLDALEKVSPGNSYKWLHEEIGTNLRLTEIQSAIGRIQLNHLERWQQKRAENALFLANYLKNISCIRIPFPDKAIKHAWYKFYIFIKPNYLLDNWNRDRIVNEIVQEGYPAFSGSCSEIYLEKCFKKLSMFPNQRCPVAKELGETSLMFLIDQTINNENLIKYAEVIKKVLIRSSK
tara:strand:+ start:421 stop:1587 length:1167 start_codon:yes stop_codon:yes gene_type:complete